MADCDEGESAQQRQHEQEEAPVRAQYGSGRFFFRARQKGASLKQARPIKREEEEEEEEGRYTTNTNKAGLEMTTAAAERSTQRGRRHAEGLRRRRGQRREEEEDCGCDSPY